MQDSFTRTALLIKKSGILRLQNAKVAVFGLGGVGSYAVEALARCGVGHLILVDHDRICVTNINRQLHATQATVGQLKVEVMAERVRSINPEITVDTFPVFYCPGETNELLSSDYDYVIDAIDTISAKVDLVVRAQELGVPIVASMGAANRLDPSKFKIADIFETHSCPVARILRKELRRRGVNGVKVVFSTELPLIPERGEKSPGFLNKRPQLGSIAFVPSVAGLLLAGVVVRELLGLEE